MSPELTVRLMTLPRAIPVLLARDRETPEGGHEAVPAQLLDAHTAAARTAKPGSGVTPTPSPWRTQRAAAPVSGRRG